MGPHEEFLELCAVLTSGNLTEEERKKLEEHLAVCSSCREALREYETVVGQAVPALAPELVQENPKSDLSWSVEKAETAFFERLAREEKSRVPPSALPTNEENPPVTHRPVYRPPANWNHIWMTYAAGIFLFVGLGIAAYQIGMRRGGEVARVTPPAVVNPLGSIPEQLSDAGYEHAQLVVQMAERDKVIADLRRQVQEESAEINKLKGLSAGLQSTAANGGQGKEPSGQEGSQFAQELKAAQAQVQDLQKKLDGEEEQRSQMLIRASSLDAKVGDLTDQLRQREEMVDKQSSTITQQQELLEHDRDIRELMGARELYIAEVYDVARNGKTNKPYGRVFYTKGKSLIFYAYDLDQQAGMKDASTFQAWGRRGPDKQQSLSLGVFYEDSTSKKRWVLKSTDLKTLEQIDAVFVTVEPDGGSHHPSGKQLLFASLRINPNHP